MGPAAPPGRQLAPRQLRRRPETELHVRFEAVGAQTRVTVEHFGWDAIPAEHAARHGFPLATFQLRFAEWWQVLLGDLAEVAAEV